MFYPPLNLPRWERRPRAAPGTRIAAIAALLLRGCPACWLVGLFEPWARGRNAANRSITSISTSTSTSAPGGKSS